MTDPHAILAEGLLALRDAGTAHITGTVTGQLQMGPVSKMLGSPIGLSGTLDLKDATFAGDVDAVHSAAQFTLTFPSLFGLRADVIAIDGATYSRVSLFGSKYSRRTADVSAAASAAASMQPTDLTSLVTSALASSETLALFAGHVPIDGRDTFRVDLTLSPAMATTALRSVAPNLAATVDSGSGTCWLDGKTLRPVQLELKAASSDLGNVAVTLHFSAYGQPVVIAAPPPDQVSGT